MYILMQKDIKNSFDLSFFFWFAVIILGLDCLLCSVLTKVVGWVTNLTSEWVCFYLLHDGTWEGSNHLCEEQIY